MNIKNKKIKLDEFERKKSNVKFSKNNSINKKNQKGNSKNSFDSEEDNEDDYIDDLPANNTKAKQIKQRSSVSAEAYGEWNKKGNYKPIVINKNEDQKSRIKKRLNQAFMFSLLDEKETEIVIGAMKEKKFK